MQRHIIQHIRFGGRRYTIDSSIKGHYWMERPLTAHVSVMKQEPCTVESLIQWLSMVRVKEQMQVIGGDIHIK